MFTEKYDIDPYNVEVTNFHNSKSAFFCLYKHDYICEQLRQNIIWEKHLHDVFDRYVDASSVVIEAGSHIGVHAVKLALLCKKLYCFEPHPNTNRILRQNFILNNIDNAEIFDCALGDTNGTTKFGWVLGNHLGGAGLCDNPMGPPPGALIEVNDPQAQITLNTLDSLNLGKVDFIKMDVEGYESKIVDGALETIQKYRPIITVECWENHQGGVSLEHTASQFSKLIDLGYTVSQIYYSDFLFLP